MDLIEFKRRLLNTGIFIKRGNKEGQYSCKECPYCGDRKNHFYVFIKMDNETPIMFNCFKCGEGKGKTLEKRFLEYYGIDLDMPKMKGKGIRRRKIKNDELRENMSNDELIFEGDDLSRFIDYIQFRVGEIPSIEDLKKFHLVGNAKRYVNMYLDGNYDDGKMNNRCWFRCNNGMIIGRRMDNVEYMGWLKHGMNDNNNAGIYCFGTFDTYQHINICIAEGIFDVIGLYYHGMIDNALYIACLGRDYMKGVKYAVDKGIVGDSVSIRIYKDMDKAVNHIPLKKEESILLNFFSDVGIYGNMIGKDFGVHKEEVEIERLKYYKFKDTGKIDIMYQLI